MSEEPPTTGSAVTKAACGSLLWAIKSSFVEYVDSAPDGERIVIGVRELSGDDGPVFEFPWVATDALDAEPEVVELRFSGSLRFRAHHGMLDVKIESPSVTFRDGWAEISIADPSGRDDQRVQIARFAVEAAGGGSLSIQTSEVLLTAHGSQSLGGVYPAQTVLSPLTINILTTDGPIDRSPTS